MPCNILVGAQWGDEGKAKIIDYLCNDAKYIVRYQGGANAGHTVLVGKEKFVFHLVPSGILHPDKMCLIGAGLVVDPFALLEEIDSIEKRGIST
ncbi:MAG: adenylosuccinate synthetase, partial [Spirochaetes bacterium]|nr:adenylosuccinate synthetase [Spirochaetota bacterium]